MGCDTPNAFALFSKSAIFSYHSVNSATFLHSATVLYQVAVFRFDVQCEGGAVRICELIFVIRLGLKLSIFEMQQEALKRKQSLVVVLSG